MTDTNTAKDPRCPYCDRPVLGTFVQGAEGRYHPACVEPPASREYRIGAVRQVDVSPRGGVVRLTGHTNTVTPPLSVTGGWTQNGGIPPSETLT